MSLDLSIYLFVDEEVRTRDWGISMADITSCSPDSKVKGVKVYPILLINPSLKIQSER